MRTPISSALLFFLCMEQSFFPTLSAQEGEKFFSPSKEYSVRYESPSSEESDPAIACDIAPIHAHFSIETVLLLPPQHKGSPKKFTAFMSEYRIPKSPMMRAPYEQESLQTTLHPKNENSHIDIEQKRPQLSFEKREHALAVSDNAQVSAEAIIRCSPFSSHFEKQKNNASAPIIDVVHADLIIETKPDPLPATSYSPIEAQPTSSPQIQFQQDTLQAFSLGKGLQRECLFVFEPITVVLQRITPKHQVTGQIYKNVTQLHLPQTAPEVQLQSEAIPHSDYSLEQEALAGESGYSYDFPIEATYNSKQGVLSIADNLPAMALSVLSDTSLQKHALSKTRHLQGWSENIPSLQLAKSNANEMDLIQPSIQSANALVFHTTPQLSATALRTPAKEFSYGLCDTALLTSNSKTQKANLPKQMQSCTLQGSYSSVSYSMPAQMSYAPKKESSNSQDIIAANTLIATPTHTSSCPSIQSIAIAKVAFIEDNKNALQYEFEAIKYSLHLNPYCSNPSAVSQSVVASNITPYAENPTPTQTDLGAISFSPASSHVAQFSMQANEHYDGMLETTAREMEDFSMPMHYSIEANVLSPHYINLLLRNDLKAYAFSLHPNSEKATPLTPEKNTPNLCFTQAEYRSAAINSIESDVSCALMKSPTQPHDTYFFVTKMSSNFEQTSPKIALMYATTHPERQPSLCAEDEQLYEYALSLANEFFQQELDLYSTPSLTKRPSYLPTLSEDSAIVTLRLDNQNLIDTTAHLTKSDLLPSLPKTDEVATTELDTNIIRYDVLSPDAIAARDNEFKKAYIQIQELPSAYTDQDGYHHLANHAVSHTTPKKNWIRTAKRYTHSARHMQEVKQLNKENRLLNYQLYHMPSVDELNTYELSDEFSKRVKIAAKPDGSGYYFSIELKPYAPERLTHVRQNVYFVIDKNVRINKQAYESYKKAIVKALKYLHPDDTFNILIFDSKLHEFSDEPVYSFNDMRCDATRFLNKRKYSITSSSKKNISWILDTINERAHDHSQVHTVVLFTNGASMYSNTKRGQKKIRAATNRHTKNYSIYPVYISGKNNVRALDYLSAQYRGVSTHSKSYVSFPRYVAKLVKRLQRPVAKNIYVTPLTKKRSGVKIFPTKDHFSEMFSHTPLTIYGFTDSIESFELFVQGQINDEWMNARIPIRIDTAEKAGSTLRKKCMALESKYRHLSQL